MSCREFSELSILHVFCFITVRISEKRDLSTREMQNKFQVDTVL